MAKKFTPPSDAIVEKGFTPPSNAVVEEPVKKKDVTEPSPSETGTSSSEYRPLVYKSTSAPPKEKSWEEKTQLIEEKKPKEEPTPDLTEALKKAKEEQFKSWKDTPEGVAQDIKNNQFVASQKAYETKQVRIIDSTKNLFETNPLFSAQNPDAEKNKQYYIQKLGDLGYNKEQIAKELGIQYQPTPVENVVNNIENIVPSVEGTIPRLQLAAAEIWENYLDYLVPMPGKEPGQLAREWYKASGRDLDQVRLDANKKLKELEGEMKPTLGIVESVKEGDLAKVISSLFGATTQVVSTVIPAIPTAGASIMTDAIGQTMNDYNETKAKELNISVEELYKTGQNAGKDVMAIGTFIGILDEVGMKGMKDVILNSVKGGATKQITDILLSSNKEGLTEWIQHGLEQYNEEIAKGTTAEEAAKKAWGSMWSEKGGEAYLQGAVGALGVTGASTVVTKKAEIETEIKKAEEEGRDKDVELLNQKKEELDQQLEQMVAEKANNDVSSVNKEIAIDDSKKEVERLTEQINDPQTTPAAKEVFQNRIDQINSAINNVEENVNKIDAKISPDNAKFVSNETQGQISEQVPQGEYREVTEGDRRNEEVANELQRRIGEAQATSPEGQEAGGRGGVKDTRQEDNQIAYQYAKETGTWIDDINSLGEPFPGGNEHTNVINEAKHKVYKSNNLASTISLSKFFDKVRLHNHLFPNTAYTFEGFTGIKDTGRGKSYVEPVYSQDFIKEATEATPAEIDQYMDSLGFKKTGDYKYEKDGVEVSDVRPRNVLKDKDGNFFVIDAEFKQLTNQKTQENDTENKTRLPGEIGKGQESISVESNQGPSREKTKTSGILQTQEEVKNVFSKYRQLNQEALSAEEGNKRTAERKHKRFLSEQSPKVQYIAKNYSKIADIIDPNRTREEGCP